MKRTAERFLRGAASPEPFSAFVPFPLPPEPPLELTPDIQELLEQANRALGRLDGVGIARELTGRKRGRLFVYGSCLGILN